MSVGISLDLVKKPFDSKKEVEWEGLSVNSQMFLHIYLEKKYNKMLFTIKTLSLVVIETSPSIFLVYHTGPGNYPDEEYNISGGYMIPKKFIERYRTTKKRFTVQKTLIIPYKDWYSL